MKGIRFLHLVTACVLFSCALFSCAQKSPNQYPEVSSNPAERSVRIPASDEMTSSMFAPVEGVLAFEKMYEAIKKAKKEVKITVYSWSDSGLDLAITAAVKEGVQVRVILHPPLSREAKIQEKVKKLEGLSLSGSSLVKGRASFKVSPKNMHEKFILVDGKMVINSSANFSNGAKTKYSENFVFHTGPSSLIQSFEAEFALLWNSSRDLLTSETDKVEEALPLSQTLPETKDKNVIFYSSSMNYNSSSHSPTSVQEGRYLRLSLKNDENGPWVVRDAIIESIEKAKKTIHGSLNHFNILSISEALVAAAKRGVDVKLTVDNQEYRTKWDPEDIEMTPHFVEEWKKLPNNQNKTAPVRVKFYSHYPNPSRWYLNHHKFFLIDVDTPEAILFNGSYNLSKTAEFNQFDNMVAYKGVKYSRLHKAFLNEFQSLWSLERKDDQPQASNLLYYTTSKNGILPIHSNRPISLSFEEIMKLRQDIGTIAPNFLRQMNRKTSSCSGFNVERNALTGCSY